MDNVYQEQAVEELSALGIAGPDNPELTMSECIVQTFHLVGLYSKAMYYARWLSVDYSPIHGGVFQ
jgi:hypothetical protein